MVPPEDRWAIGGVVGGGRFRWRLLPPDQSPGLPVQL